MPYQLYDIGFKNITVVDYSSNARKAMSEAIAQRPGLTYDISNINCY